MAGIFDKRLRLFAVLLALGAVAAKAEPEWLLPETMAGRTVREIRLEGNQQTRDLTILRELYQLPGRPLDLDLLARDLRFLEGLGIFVKVDARVRPREEGVDLLLRVQERSRGSMVQFYPTLEINEEYDWKAGLTFRHRNVGGRREDFLARRSLGWEDEVVLRLSRPWMGSFPLEHRLSYSFKERDDEDADLYRNERFSATAYFPLDRSRPTARRFLLGGQVGRRLQEEEDGAWDEILHSLTVGFLLDSRRSYLRPRQGGQMQLTVTVFHPRLASSHDLRQGVLRLTRYQRLGRGKVLAGKLELDRQWGSLYHRAAWSLGGFSSLRGRASGQISGWEGADEEAGAMGRNRLVAQLEFRCDLFPRTRFQWKRLGSVDIEGEAVFFLDAGMIWRAQSLWDLDSGNRAGLGAGLGLRFFSPFGDILRIELGFNEIGTYQVHMGNQLPF